MEDVLGEEQAVATDRARCDLDNARREVVDEADRVSVVGVGAVGQSEKVNSLAADQCRTDM